MAATSSGSGSQRPVVARRSSSWRAVRSTSSASGRYTWPSLRATIDRTYFSAACRRNGEVGAMPSMSRKLSAVRKPMPWTSSARRYGFSRTMRAASSPYASRTRRASALPRPMCLSHESTSAMVATWANDSRMARARSGVMPLMTHSSSGLFAQDLEHAVAEALDRFGGANGPEMRGVRHQEGDHAAAVEVIDELERVDPHLPAVLRRGASRCRRCARRRAA